MQGLIIYISWNYSQPARYKLRLISWDKLYRWCLKYSPQIGKSTPKGCPVNNTKLHSLGSLDSVEYFTAITTRSTLIRSGSSCLGLIYEPTRSFLLVLGEIPVASWLKCWILVSSNSSWVAMFTFAWKWYESLHLPSPTLGWILTLLEQGWLWHKITHD